METLAESAARLLEIEARQDEALRQLEELERRIEAILAEYSTTPAKAPQPERLGPAVKAA